MNTFTMGRRKFLAYSGLVSSATILGLNACKDRKSLRFGIVTDTHYADREVAGSRYYRQAKEKLKEFVSLMNEKKVDFVVHLGDFKDQDENPVEENTLQYLRELEAVFQGFDGPTYHVLGNHDMDSISKKQFLENVTNTDIAKDLSYYSFDFKDHHFIVLDANYRSDMQSYEKGNFEWTDPNLPEEQLEWLREDLKQNIRPTIVFIHQPLDGDDHYFVKNSPKIRTILEESGQVHAVLQGHMHQERHNHINGIHYCTFLAVVDGDGEENNCYSVAEVQEDGILLTGYRRANSGKLR